MSFYDLFLIFSFLLGSCLGSFYNVCIFRYIEGKSIVTPPSHCPKCGHYLRWWENIPILSYFLLRGKCSSCKTKISFQYPLVEFLSGIWALILGLKYGYSIEFVIYLIFGGLFIILSFIDFKTYLLPDILTIPGIILAFFCSLLLRESFLTSFLGFVFGAGFFLLVQQLFEKIAKKEGLGTGDIKLMALIGFLLGPLGVWAVSLMASFLAIIVWIFYYRTKGEKLLPFGPFLSLAAMIYIILGESLFKKLYEMISIGI